MFELIPPQCHSDHDDLFCDLNSHDFSGGSCKRDN